MLRFLEEKAGGLRNEILKESAIRGESLDNLNQALEVRCLMAGP